MSSYGSSDDRAHSASSSSSSSSTVSSSVRDSALDSHSLALSELPPPPPPPPQGDNSNPLSPSAATPTEADALLPNRNTTNHLSASQLYERGTIYLPHDYPSPIQEQAFKPYPIATGTDAYGEFEVYPPSIHPAGRHYHYSLDAYRPCPPCLTPDTAHESTESYTLAGWLLGICCFPIGLLCCCFMTRRSCAKCQATLEA